MCLARRLQAAFPNAVTGPDEFHGQVSVTIASPERVLEVLRYARDELGFEMLLDLTAVHYPGRDLPWCIVYHLRSLGHNALLRVKLYLAQAEPGPPSAVGLWPAAEWLEREVYDMFGIRFEGHPCLRRILMWDGYPYHPLRKDFPLAGVHHRTADGLIFTEPAPMEGGPFFARPGDSGTTIPEPRAPGATRLGLSVCRRPDL